MFKDLDNWEYENNTISLFQTCLIFTVYILRFEH